MEHEMTSHCCMINIVVKQEGRGQGSDCGWVGVAVVQESADSMGNVYL